ncbi:uncharacterized protein LOC129885734 [Solanum dulcamara]|uniref:uncharacterized protein LOC129885734 n=1 Tax=Solanum dulcamara TaxID=45834 RepID=UPI002485E79F|nr:uncharacterized protein LOC129885734 [Solanum dulcamara]
MAFKLNCFFFVTLSMIAIASTICLAANDDQKLSISFGRDNWQTNNPNGDINWHSMDPNDPKVVDLANFAVKEANKKYKGNRVFKYVKVTDAAYTDQIYDSYRVYDILVVAIDTTSGVTHRVLTVVKEGIKGKQKGRRELESFDPLFT